MIWFLVAQIFSTLISLIQIGRKTESDKDLEIMVLRVVCKNSDPNHSLEKTLPELQSYIL